MRNLCLTVVFGLALLAVGGISRGAEPGPALAGAYGIDYQLIGGGLWCHTYTIDALNPGTGEFTGTGHYVPDPSYTEIITGKFDGKVMTFHVLYTGTNAGYTVDAVGSVDAEGRLSGTATSPGQEFTWTCSRVFAVPSAGPAAETWWDQLKALSQNAVQRLGWPEWLRLKCWLQDPE